MAVSAITIAFRYLIAVYAELVEGIHQPGAIAWGIRDRHQHDVGLVSLQQPFELVRAADDGHAVDAAPPQPRVVIDEAEHPLAGRLAKLAHQAAAGAAGADDQRAAARAVA